jgi:hypothetical protein
VDQAMFQTLNLKPRAPFKANEAPVDLQQIPQHEQA